VQARIFQAGQGYKALYAGSAEYQAAFIAAAEGAASLLFPAQLQ
jgi:hypothetical protein